MKNFKIVLLILPLLGISCSQEMAEEIAGAQIIAYGGREEVAGAANPANPQDSAGRLHNEILEALEEYDLKVQSVAGIAAIVDSTAATFPAVGLACGNAPLPARVAAIEALANGSSSLADVLEALAMGAAAKASILNFANSMELIGDDPYDGIWLAVIAYEAGVLESSAFSAGEKEVMLAAASVVRYSVQRKKRKDKDWETSVSIAAVVSGEGESLCSRLKLAAAVSLCRENGILK